MDRQSCITQARILRGVISRLNASNPTHPSQLVLTAQRSISDLSFCKDILSASDEQLKASQTDAGVTVHSFKTKISSLLQDKHAPARLAAIVLVKATIHLGGYEVLNKNGAVWTRALLGQLIKAGPASSKRLVILVLAQIYRATRDLPNLTREVTTPTLKDFIPACIGLVTTKHPETNQQTPYLRSPLLPDVLLAFLQLLPHHPSVFRPFSNILSVICGRVISLTSVEDSTAFSATRVDVQALAQRLLAQIPRCAPRNAAAEEWARNVRLVKEHVVQTADEVFRSIIETINPEAASIQSRSTTTKGKPSEQPLGYLSDELHLTKWTGLESGIERLCNLLQTLQALIAAQGALATQYTLAVDMVLNVVERVMNVFPGQKPEDLLTVANNAEFSREERELLFLRVDRLQAEAIDTLKVLCQRLGYTSLSVANGALEHLVWCFGSGIPSDRLRATYYDAVTTMISICGQGMSTKLMQNLSNIIRAAGDDICIRSNTTNDTSNGKTKAGQNSADAYLTITPKSNVVLADGPAHESAKRLFLALLKHVAAEAMPNDIRALIDRSVVLVRDEEAMLASVLNVASEKRFADAHASILPFLAREHPQSMRTEAILRPRLPPIAKRLKVGGDEEEEGEEESSFAETRGFGQSIAGYSRENDGDDEADQMEVEDQSVAPGEGASSLTLLSTGSIPVQPGVESSFPRPQSPKRLREAEDEKTPSLEGIKRVRLSTFEAAPGPTPVAVITERAEQTASVNTEHGDDSDSDGSSMPSIHMDDLADDDDEEEEEQ